MEGPVPGLSGAGLTRVEVLGVRHHGPGSARAVVGALEELEPDTILIEGPEELEPIVDLLADPAARTPLAGLVYSVDEPSKAMFYPFASFSPEYQAIRHALDTGARIGFIDLPATFMLAWSETEEEEHRHIRTDPIARLSEVAGFTDPERWWEDVLEHRHPGAEIFSAVTGAMATLRGAEPDSRFTLVREAAMRRRIRAAMKNGAERIAVVCGAWHAPLLDPDDFPSATSDNQLLKGLAKAKVAATWVPWTSDRLSLASGYGAGVSSPAWYRHLFTTPGERVIAGWMTRAARLLRDGGYECSPAAVLEASRLADALASIRGRPIAGIVELDDAAVAVLCGGSAVRIATIADDLYVGRELGSVPANAPTVPLARDLDAHIKRLRMTKSAEEKLVELDLRTPSHLDRSRLFHRLALLNIGWATSASTIGRTLGTFKEAWILEWRPEYEIAVVEAAALGATVAAAASSALVAEADVADLGRLVGMIEHGMLADLPAAVDSALDHLRRRVAALDDLGALMEAIEPLARVSRYGDVRGRSDAHTRPVLKGLVTRVSVGLAAGCSSLDDEAAAVMYQRMGAVHRGVSLLDDEPEMEDQWLAAVASVAAMRDVHGLVAGHATRLLSDRGRIDADEASAAVSRALSRGADHERAAVWLEGFLTGDAMLLIHDRGLLGLVDDWLVDVPAEIFDDLLPLLRRAFSRFSSSERRLLGVELKHLEQGTGDSRFGSGEIDERRADLVLPTVMALLGASDD